MCDKLKHGGPDDEGVFCDEEQKLVFGHRRLSIIDLSKNGHQPMADLHQSVWITFNGEIYNFQELRCDLLKAGAKFHSATDTEVIINAYLLWGEAAFSKLKGMFAFALFDKSKALTYLVRDTSGIKPLYYRAASGELIFASEVKAIRATDNNIEPDPKWPARFLAYGHIPEPYTTLKDVFSLPKGHFLLLNHQTGLFKISSYNANTISGSIITSISEAYEKLNNSLHSAVKRQLIADAAIGVFLSGGIDSSLITLLANEQTEQQLKTISIYFNEKTYDERAYQNEVLSKVSGEKFAHLVQQEDFEKQFPSIINDMDMPTTDGINTWFISKYAHEDGLKAVLSGVGADELFGGYPSFNRIKYLKQLRRIPAFIARSANYFKTDRYRKLSFLAHDHYLADYLLLRGLYAPVDIAKIIGAGLSEVEDILFEDAFQYGPLTYDEQHAAWFESNLYMQNQLLRDTDVMSMSHGLEVRVPFLDEDFRELAAVISPEIRFSKTQPKKMLIDSFKNILPESVWNRPKMGFTFPLQQWMSHHSEISSQQLYKGKIAKESVLKFKTGQIHWSKIFALYQIQLHA